MSTPDYRANQPNIQQHDTNQSTAAAVLAALEPYALKQEHDGKYRCNSPLRPGANSHSFTLTIDDSEHGAYYDHRSGEQGSLYDLADKLDIPRPQRAAIQDTKRLYSGIDDYARAHGIPVDVLRAPPWSWRQVTYQSRPALEYPTLSGRRWRFLDADGTPDKNSYTSPRGYQRCWYGVTDRLRSWLKFPGNPLVICNGEISTIAAQVVAVPAIAMTGGEKALPENLINELRSITDTDREILVAFDCDDTGRTYGIESAKNLRAAGYSARTIDLGLGNKGDLADFCMLHGQDALPALQACPELPEQELQFAQAKEPAALAVQQSWQTIKADDLGSMPPIEWLLPEILQDKSITLVFGRPGEGKTFWALDMAYRIAKSSGPVLYIAAEGMASYPVRYEAYKKHNKVDGLPNLDFLFETPNLADPAIVQDLIDKKRANGYRAIFIDPMQQTMLEGDENSTRDMGKYTANLNRIRNELSCAVVIVHHKGRSGEKARGSSVLDGMCDMMHEVHQEDLEIRIECEKSRNTEKFKTLKMGFEKVDTTVCLVPFDTIADDGKLTTAQAKVLEILANSPSADGLTRSEIELDAPALNHNTVGSVLRRFAKRGLVEIDQKGKPKYLLTGDGKKLAGAS